MTVSTADHCRFHQGDGVTRAFAGPVAHSRSRVKAFIILNEKASELESGDFDVERIGDESGTRIVMHRPPSSAEKILLINVASYAHKIDAAGDIPLAEAFTKPRLDTLAMHNHEHAKSHGGLREISDSTPSTVSDTRSPFPMTARERNEEIAGTASSEGDDTSLRESLAQTDGGSLIGYSFPASGEGTTVKDFLDGLWAGTGARNIRFQQTAATGAAPIPVSDKLSYLPVSVLEFGADRTGSSDSSSAFQAAVDDVQNRGGGVVHVPYGIYRIDTAVTISRGGIAIKGDGVLEEFVGPFGSTVPQLRGNGSWILLGSENESAFVLASGSNNVQIAGIGFDQTKPSPTPDWNPPAYKPCIRINAGGACLLENLVFLGVTAGIEIGQPGVSTGRTRIENVWGEFFSFGIKVNFAADVVRVNNFHQYPFWSAFTADVAAYTQKNTYGLVSYRNDNCQITNFFVYGVWRGIYLATSGDGATNKMMVANADLDACATGVLVDGSGITASMTNIQCQPGPNTQLSNSRGIFVNGDGNSLMLCNLRVARTTAEAVFVSGNGNAVGISNCYFDNWDDALSGAFTAISSTSDTNRIHLSGSITYFTGTGNHGAFLGGQMRSYHWPNCASGSLAATVDSSGSVAIAHGLGFAPARAFSNNQTDYAFLLNVINIDNTNIYVSVRDVNKSGERAASGSNLTINWSASM
ncbi:glycoside hydrolase family 55 protein [Xanthomonas sacchari]|uniref:glycoside hydrolase family 55 protein n=1 Tax=Xanthomonas sacchari TaxID=56458 RepID=UPI0020C24615|nr:glycoside hydrolase family 55 protein [Xanthomonas sacchari]